MTTAEQLKALIKSHAARDDDRFYSVALQVAAREARSGHAVVAQDLKVLVDSSRSQRSADRVKSTGPKREMAGLLSVEYPSERLVSLSLTKPRLDELKRVLLEYYQSDRLLQHGFLPTRRVLLVGAAGTGKTMTARALAGELDLPLYTVRLDGLITRFMGETAAKLRLIFDELNENVGVYLFDEVDALAGERSQSNDVGEARRVLNSFLQFLENDRSSSVIVATTNLPELLDRALFRRFDTTLRYGLPDAEVVKSIILNRLTSIDLGAVDWGEVESSAAGLSHAEVTIATERAAKNVLLRDDDKILTSDLVSALDERQEVAEIS